MDGDVKAIIDLNNKIKKYINDNSEEDDDSSGKSIVNKNSESIYIKERAEQDL